MTPRFDSTGVLAEPLVVAANRAFLEERGIVTLASLLGHEELRYQRLRPEDYLDLSHSLPEPVATFNDIAAQREAAVAGFGWGLFPRYAVQRELSTGLLHSVNATFDRQEQFGVWHLRSRDDLAPLVRRLIDWLGHQTL